MKELIKAIKNLQDVIQDDPDTAYTITKGLDGVIDALVEKTISEMKWRGKVSSDPATTPAKKEKIEASINWLFKNMKPFEQRLRDLNPELKESFDKRSIMVTKMDEEFRSRRKQ